MKEMDTNYSATRPVFTMTNNFWTVNGKTQYLEAKFFFTLTLKKEI